MYPNQNDTSREILNKLNFFFNFIENFCIFFEFIRIITYIKLSFWQIKNNALVFILNIFKNNFCKYLSRVNKIFFITYNNDERGVCVVKSLDSASIIGDNFMKLLDLRPPAIILYCLIASYAVSPSGMVKDFDLDSDEIPCFCISKYVAEQLPSFHCLTYIELRTICLGCKCL